MYNLHSIWGVRIHTYKMRNKMLKVFINNIDKFIETTR